MISSAVEYAIASMCTLSWQFPIFVCLGCILFFFFFGIKNEAVMNTPEHRSLHTTLPSTPGKSPKGDFVNSCCFSEMHWQAARYREPVMLP